MDSIILPKVSIIILNWNGFKDTIECLDSIKRFNYPNYDVIVVDNASSDNSATEIKRLYPETILISNRENKGYSGGNNVGIRHAFDGGSEYVWLLNNDAIANPDTLHKLVNFALGSRRAGLISPVIYDYYDRSKIQFCGSIFDWQNFRIKCVSDLKGGQDLNDKDIVLWGTALLISRKVVDKIGYLNEKYFAYCEDSDYSLRSLKAGFINKIEFSASVFHKCHGAEIDKKNQSNYVFYMTRNQYLFWSGSINLFKKAAYLRKYLVGSFEDVGYYRDAAKDDLVNAVLDGMYCAFRSYGGSRALSLRMPNLLKKIVLSHPFLYAYILRGDFKKIVSKIVKIKNYQTKPANQRYSCSAVICTKDRITETLSCVESILKQTVLPKEIVIIDSSGSDGLGERLKEKNSLLPIRYFRSSPGTTHQRNVGVKHCSTDILLFIDDDIVLDKDFIKEMNNVFITYGGSIGGVMGNIVNDSVVKTPMKIRIIRKLFQMPDYGNGKFRLSGQATNPLGVNKVKRVEFLLSGITAYRREVLKEFAFDEERLNNYALLEDNDFSYRISRKYKNYFTPFAKCCHYPSKVNRLSPEAYKALFLKNSAYLFKKNIPNNLVRRTAFRLAAFGIKNRVDQLPFPQIAALVIERLLGKRITNVPRVIYRKFREGAKFLAVTK